ncbi:MAG: NAD-dependent epimerase/dehydratase family protein [Bacteroidota bacterium]
MKILITGANGFLAANIVRELNRRGLPVRGMVRKTADLRSLEGAGWEPFYGSFLDPDDLGKAIKDCEVVIHVAAFTGPTPTRLKHYLEPNVEGTRRLAEACLLQQVKRLIYVSSVNSIGFGSAENPGREEWPIGGPPFSRSGYAVSKLMAEEVIQEYVRDKGLNAVIVNPSFMIGPYDAKPSSNRILLMYYERAFSLVPPGGKNFVDVRDVATAVCNAVDRGSAGERYILAHENLTINEFFNKVDSVTGRKQKHIHVPAALIRLLGMLGGLANIFGSGYQLDPVTAHILCVRNFYSAEKAIRELGMPQTPIEEAIKAAWEWLRKS